MAWLPDGEKNLEDTFIRFHMIHERDRQTQTPHDSIGRAYAYHRAARQKRTASINPSNYRLL